MNINKGVLVRIKKGATEWMKKNGYWIDDMVDTDNIDGELAKIVNDHTDLSGKDSHYGVEFDNNPNCIGIHPDFIEVIF